MRILSILLIVFLMFSCSNSSEKPQQKQEKNTTPHGKTSNSIGEVLSSESRELVKNWKEYNNVEQIIGEYYEINTKDATYKAHELSKYTQQLKDSIRIKLLKRPDVKIRLNILHNSALRLSDMDSIPQVNVDEIKNEIKSTLNSFSSINSKINNILKKQALEKELVDFKN